MSFWRFLFDNYIIINVAKKYAQKKCRTIAKQNLIKSLINKSENKYSAVDQELKKNKILGEQNWKIQLLNKFYLHNKSEINKKLKKFPPKEISLHKINIESETDEQLCILPSKLNCNIIDIYQYFSSLQEKEKFNTFQTKMSEELWKTITMAFITLYGTYVVCNSDFFYDPSLLFNEWPQAITPAMTLYYQIGIGYHGHRACHQFYDTHRKDFWAMLAHHWITVFLIMSSWALEIMPLGCMVMFIHDNSDFLLSLAKVCKYLEFHTMANVAFALFCLSWVVFRIFLFAKKIIYSAIFDARGKYDCHQMYFILLFLLLTLFALHVYWSKFIIAAAYKSVVHQQNATENRSDSELETEEKENETKSAK